MKFELAKNGIGERVIYSPYPGCNKSMNESGSITRVNTTTRMVFVLFDGDEISKCCRPDDLEFDFTIIPEEQIDEE